MEVAIDGIGGQHKWQLASYLGKTKCEGTEEERHEATIHVCYQLVLTPRQGSCVARALAI